jgi:hypothetical protein
MQLVAMQQNTITVLQNQGVGISSEMDRQPQIHNYLHKDNLPDCAQKPAG